MGPTHALTGLARQAPRLHAGSKARILTIHDAQYSQWRISLQPVIHEQEQKLLVLASAADQDSHGIARFRVRVANLVRH